MSRDRRTARLMKFVRRTHLYTGLLLIPLVLLYGVTAFLFNHPAAFSDSEIVHIPADATRGHALLEGFSPEVLAREVARTIAPEGDGPPPSVSNVRLGSRLSIDLRDDETSGRLTVSSDGAARLFMRPRRTSTESPFDRSRLEVGKDDLEEIEARAGDLARTLGHEPHRISVRSLPVLFDLHVGDETWEATYDPARGSLRCREPITSERPLRSTLLRLHKMHGYPAGDGARTLWAILVDVMAGAMVLWGLSGLVMWWQLKKTRLFGGAVLVIGGSGIIAAMFWIAGQI